MTTEMKLSPGYDATTGIPGIPVKEHFTDGAAHVRITSSAAAATGVSAEDTASANGDPGVVILARRTASPANTSNTDGDYEVPQMNAGRLWVSAAVESNAELGIVTETAPATDTASSGLNGRLQRIAQRITSLIALIPTALTSLGNFKVSLQEVNANAEYETVAASQSAQVLGATGAIGDYIAGILVVPATTSPGNVLLLDNATSITVFTGGASSVSNLVPFYIPLNMISVSGAWKITTGSNVSCIGIGNFTT